MAGWAKIKFFWETMMGSAGSTLAASSTRSGFEVEHIHNMMETNMWVAAEAAAPHYITFDAGEGQSAEADYLAVSGHNLNSTGASVSLEYSADGLSWGEALALFSPASDMTFVREFASPGSYRHWRLRIEGTTAAPSVAVCIWGRATELDYASASFDPNEQEAMASVNLSQGGYLAGAHRRYTERAMTLRFEDAGPELYQKVAEWWEGSGLKNLFVAWEPSGHSEEVFLMRPEPRFSNPLKAGGAYRDITIKLAGRKE